MTVQNMDLMTLPDGRLVSVSGDLMKPYLEKEGLRCRPKSTACRRGHRSRWKVSEGRLWLTSSDGSLSDGGDLWETLSPDGAPVRADWISGILNLHGMAGVSNGSGLIEVEGGSVMSWEFSEKTPAGKI